MQRVAATFGALAILALLAGGLTEATMALGGRGSLANDILMRPHNSGNATSSVVSPKPTASPTPTPIATPAPTPIPVVAGPTATTNSFVHMRAGKSTSTAIITDLNGGTVVQLLTDSDSQWQQVHYNGFTGYVFKQYLTY